MIVPFNPTPAGPFTFQPTLDGQQYTVVIRWNIYGQRYYLFLYTSRGARVLTRAMVGSPNGYDINLVDGYFNSVLVYREPSNQFEITP